jgi:hypothetical protein
VTSLVSTTARAEPQRYSICRLLPFLPVCHATMNHRSFWLPNLTFVAENSGYSSYAGYFLCLQPADGCITNAYPGSPLQLVLALAPLILRIVPLLSKRRSSFRSLWALLWTALLSPHVISVIYKPLEVRPSSR